MKPTYALVVIGTSWGGLHALTTLLRGIPRAFSIPLIVVQHRGREVMSILPELLQEHTSLTVGDAEDKESLLAHHVYLAPADYHLLVEQGFMSLSTDPFVKYSRPSIDVTFQSAADSYGERTIGVVLTGANDDGAQGLRRIADRNGYAIVQDPATAESPAMPAAALRAVPGARVLQLAQIASYLTSLTARPVVQQGRSE
ncbi:MAG: chemotaxis protein CheB [Gemmatimonadota bacterium]|nr:chemotaxis protein CheB [Gemmatimonadota bacterium]